jgi:phosphatidylglycerol:prolipoprotein diacylglycerol transferase
VKPNFLEFDLPLLGQVDFPAYVTMMMVGFMAAIWLAQREADRLGMPPHQLFDLGILMLVCGIMGARLMSVLTDGKLMDFVHLCTEPTLVEAVDAKVARCTADAQCGYDYLCDAARGACYPPRDCLAALKFWHGGLTYYGGFLLAVPVACWYARRKALGVARVADLGAPLVMVGLFFGRFGCFFNGCCYGAPTGSWLGVKFPGHAHPLHPTQLYEAAAALAIYALLTFVIRPRKRGDGELFGWLLLLYGGVRFAIEILRADERGSLGPLSTSQIISIPLAAAGLWLILHIRRRAAARGADDDGVTSRS